jgi:tetratricopeptide (TPR) repeat protein/SAM-dependent methyltransferase
MADNPEQIYLKDVHPQIMRAYQLRDENKLDEAIALGQQCLANLPDHSEVNLLMGVLYIDKKQYILAERFLAKALAMNSDRLEYYLVYGQLMRATGRYVAARNAFARCLVLDPSHFMATFYLARIYQIQSDDKHAKVFFDAAFKLNDAYAPLHYYYGAYSDKNHQFEKAEGYYQRAIELDPHHLGAIYDLGILYSSKRQFPQAIEQFNHYLELRPEHAGAYAELGKVHYYGGDQDKARQYYRLAVDMNPLQAKVWLALVYLTQYDDEQGTDKAIMLENLRNPGLSEQDIKHYHFAIAKIYHDCHKFSQSLEHLEKGHQHCYDSDYADVHEYVKQFHAIPKIFTPTKLKRSWHKSESRVKPIFVIHPSRGYAKASAVALANHPDIAFGGELGFAEIIQNIPDKFKSNKNFPDWAKQKKSELVKVLRKQYLQQLQKKNPDKKRWVVDCCPDMVLYVGLAALLFPDAKFIVLDDDMHESALKMYADPFAKAFTSTNAIAFYCQHYHTLLKHWKKCALKGWVECKGDVESSFAALQLSTHPTFLSYPGLNYSDYEEILAEHLDLREKVKASVLMVEHHQLIKHEFDAAVKAFHEGDLSLAKEICNDLLRHSPESAKVWHLIGLVNKSIGDALTAEKALKQALNHDKNNLQIYRDLSFLYHESGDYVQAKKVNAQMKSLLKSYVKLFGNISTQKIDDFKDYLHKGLPKPKTVGQNVLFKGKLTANCKNSVLSTQTWDRYFYHISHGSFRNINQPGAQAWRMHSWYFLFKNMSLIEDIYSHSAQDVAICDMGCASGYLKRFLEGNFSAFESKQIIYWGVDIDEGLLKDAMSNTNSIEAAADSQLIPAAYLAHDVQHPTPFKDEQFDYVINFELIKYLPIASGAEHLQDIHRILKPGGILFISSTYSADHPGYIETIPFEELEHMLEVAGFKVEKRYGSQNHFRRLATHLKEEHVPLFKELMTYHPPEVVVAMIAPLYPQLGEQITLRCIKL